MHTEENVASIIIVYFLGATAHHTSKKSKICI